MYKFYCTVYHSDLDVLNRGRAFIKPLPIYHSAGWSALSIIGLYSLVLTYVTNIYYLVTLLCPTGY